SGGSFADVVAPAPADAASATAMSSAALAHRERGARRVAVVLRAVVGGDTEGILALLDGLGHPPAHEVGRTIGDRAEARGLGRDRLRALLDRRDRLRNAAVVVDPEAEVDDRAARRDTRERARRRRLRVRLRAARVRIPVES